MGWGSRGKEEFVGDGPRKRVVSSDFKTTFVLRLKDFKGSRRREADKPGGREQFQGEAMKGEKAGRAKQERWTVTPRDGHGSLPCR